MFLKNCKDCKPVKLEKPTPGIQQRSLAHPKSDEIAIDFSLGHAFIESGQTFGPFRWNLSTVLFIHRGVGSVTIENSVFQAKEGDVIFVPAHEKWESTNIGSQPLELMGILNEPWEDQHAEEV